MERHRRLSEVEHDRVREWKKLGVSKSLVWIGGIGLFTVIASGVGAWFFIKWWSLLLVFVLIFVFDLIANKVEEAEFRKWLAENPEPKMFQTYAKPKLVTGGRRG